MNFRRDLPASPVAASLAREALDDWLPDLVRDAETTIAARLAASEIVANAVRHGGLQDNDVIQLKGVATDEVVRLEFGQPSSAADAHLVAAEDGDPRLGGYGLRIVDEVTAQWGVRPGPPGVVWFEVPRRSAVSG